MTAEIKAFTGGQRNEDSADELCKAVKSAVYHFSDRIPLALAIGVLEIAKQEIMEDQK
mgnify:CR=1 FL=1